MARNVKVVIDEQGVQEFLRMNKEVRDLLVGVGQDVAAEAQATASDAEKGPGGRLDGYADAGFSVKWEQRQGRPRVNVVSNADPQTALGVYFSTQKRWGIAHLRRALYKFTTRGG